MKVSDHFAQRQYIKTVAIFKNTTFGFKFHKINAHDPLDDSIENQN